MLKYLLPCFILACTLFGGEPALQAQRDAGYQYIYPAPQSTLVPTRASVIIRFADAAPKDLRSLDSLFSITGEKSGAITGDVLTASDGKTIIFQPSSGFKADEIVTVTIEPKVGVNKEFAPKAFSFSFSTQRSDENVPSVTNSKESAEAQQTPKSAMSAARIMANGVSVPGDFPHIRIFTHKETADGYIFINNWRDKDPYNIIFNNDGSPVWYERQPDGDRRRDFKVQKNGIITMLTRHGGNRFLGYDQNFKQIDEFKPAGGYGNDEHELQVLENGNYLIIGRRNVPVDMSDIVPGGNPNANVRETTVQEFTPDHQMIFNWPALTHLHDGLAYLELNDPAAASFNFPHINAVDIDQDDDHILVSSRHLSEITKVNRQTGDIIWRLGGAHNQFFFVNDPLNGFRNQHDIRSLGNGLYSVFDNGNNHTPSRSRGVIYKLDTDAMTATLVWEFRNPKGASLTFYMGNHQKLANGNSLINWAVGDRPKVTEVTPDGEVVYEMNFVEHYHTYRAFRFPWAGVVAKPCLFVEQDIDNVVLIFNKFGDTNVAYYNIYGGVSPNTTSLLDTSKKTLKSLNVENDTMYYFRVTAVYADGSESDFSNEENVLVKKIEPDVNLVPNGDFSKGKEAWTFQVQGAGDAEWEIEDGVCHFIIRNGGSPHYSVQLRQNSFPLITGQRYLFEFDAWADAPKTIEAKVGRDHSPHTNYSKIGLSALARSQKHFAYEFVMEDPTDLNGRVVINVGDSDPDVYLDNVSLKLLSESDVERESINPPQNFALLGNYPNPFNAATTIDFFVPTSSRVFFELFDLLGRRQQKSAPVEYQSGQHQVRLDASSLNSGIYFYRMTATDMNGVSIYSARHKMMVIK